MNLKLLIALLSTGIVVLLGGTAVVASLPARTSGANVSSVASKSLPSPSSSATAAARSAKQVPTSRSQGPTTHRTSVTAVPTTTSTVPTEPPSTTSTDFVLVTISYAVKTGDTVTSIAKWFDQHGYGVQFGANLQVIDSNENLLVPGAIISISNGVMTIHSPV
jgi:hypothetical protein